MLRKIAHIADVHLRDRQYAYSSRGEDFSRALHNAVFTAIVNGANAIICAGDLLDSSRPSASAISGCLAGIHRLLMTNGVPMYVISGNHDLAGTPWTEVFSAVSGESTRGIISIDHREVKIGELTLKGIPFMSNENMRAELTRIKESEVKPDIITWHGAIREFAGYPNPDSICIDDFKGCCRLVAMGDQHVHSKSTREYEDGQLLTVAYPGSTELCDESECENKALLMYSWEGKELVEIESISFDTKPVQRFVLNTELDLENALTQIKRNSLIFIKYNRNLENVIPRLNTVLSPENILRHVALPDTNKKDMTKVGSSEEPIVNLQEFVGEKLKTVVEEEQASRIKDLCLSLVSSGTDHRYAIDKFCADKLEGKTIL